MPTTTTNFSLNKPLVNNATDQDLWGGYWNDNADTIDAQLKVARDSLIRTISGSDSLVAGDRRKTLNVSASGGTATITLLAAATAGDGFECCIKKSDSSGNAVVIDGSGSETIDGATTYSLTGQYDAVILMCNGSAWLIKAYKTTPSAVASASTSAAGIIEIATAAEVQAGSSTALAVTPGDMKTAMGFSTYYDSGEQAYTVLTAVTATHSLGAIPKLLIVELVCKTTEGGWAVDDRVQVSSFIGQSNNFGITIGYSTTQITANIPSSGIGLINKSTGGSFTLTPSNWRIVFRAWA